MFAAFRAHLHRGGAYAYYHILPQRRSYWYDLSDPPELAPETARTNLYFSVHPVSAIPPCNAHGEVRQSAFVRGQLRYIAAINCLFAEFDDKDYGDQAAILTHLDRLCVPAPTAIIASGGGVHAYWLLKEPYLIANEDRRQAARTIQDRWVALVGGDPGAKDLTRILRVPGSWNYKYDPRRQVDWLACDLTRCYPLRTLTAHLPPVTIAPVPPVQCATQGSPSSITEYNERMDIGDVLTRRGYRWVGTRKMLSPWSSTGSPGVTIDPQTNRAFVHHGSDPLHDGYWKRPFDVICILDCNGDFKKALATIRERP